MADEKQTESTQLELSFPNPDDFPSYDEVDSEQGQAELPDNSYDESSVIDSESGCCVNG